MQITQNISTFDSTLLKRSGVYPFTVRFADEVSNLTRQAIRLCLEIYADGEHYEIQDVIDASNLLKIIQFANATTLQSVFKNNSISAQDCIGLTGHVRLYLSYNEAMDRYEFTVNGYLPSSNLE